MKLRIISFLLLLTMLCMPLSIYAADKVTLEVSSASANAGEEFEVTVNVTSTVGFSVLMIKPYCDTGITYVSAKNGGLLSSMTAGKNILFDSGSDCTQSGLLVTLTFKAEEGITSGDYSVGVEFCKNGVVNSSEEKLDGSVTMGKVTVAGTDPVVVHTHSLQKVEAKKSTCVEQGNSAYYVCSGCGKMFSDANGTNEISAVPYLALAAHTGGTATCDRKAICSVCGQSYGSYAEHSYGSTYSYNSTYHWKECKVCGHKEDKVVHTLEWSDSVDRKTEQGVCKCGYTESRTIEETNPAETERETEKATEKVTVLETERETEKVTEKVTELETERETEKVTEKVTELETERETEKVTEKVTELETERETEKVTEKVTELETEREAEKVTEKVTELETERETEKVTEQETDTDTDNVTECETEEDTTQDSEVYTEPAGTDDVSPEDNSHDDVVIIPTDDENGSYTIGNGNYSEDGCYMAFDDDGCIVKNADGKYLTVKGGKLKENDSAYIWSYDGNSVYTVVNKYPAFINWILSIFGRKTETVTYYLTVNEDGFAVTKDKCTLDFTLTEKDSYNITLECSEKEYETKFLFFTFKSTDYIYSVKTDENIADVIFSSSGLWGDELNEPTEGNEFIADSPIDELYICVTDINGNTLYYYYNGTFVEEVH